MPINRLHVRGYRSIRDVHMELKQINVILGANGTGKSNLYRSLHLLWMAAEGSLARAISKEGGMSSALWVGAYHKTEHPHMSVEVGIDDLTYKLVIGHVPYSDRQGSTSEPAGDSMRFFYRDPDIKIERLTVDYRGKAINLLERKRGRVSARNMDGRPIEYPLAVHSCESVLAGLREPHLFPDLSSLRSTILSWRFYHHFNTGPRSLLRRPQAAVFTPIMSHDGSDLVSALATICAVEGPSYVQSAIGDAFGGAEISFMDTDGNLELQLKMPEFRRAFSVRELSDGTLQYLCILAALNSTRPPLLLALNEPETSIHPDLYKSLAKLIVDAGKRSQMWVTTHSVDLARYITEVAKTKPLELEKVDGATRIIGAKIATRNDDFDFLEGAEDDRLASKRMVPEVVAPGAAVEADEEDGFDYG